MKKSLAITLAAAALIVVALAALAVLTAVAGQQSGLEKSTARHCVELTPAAARAATDSDYPSRLTALARCTAGHDG
jgi:hypothetical protein